MKKPAMRRVFCTYKSDQSDQNAPNNINTTMRLSGTPNNHKRIGTVSSYSMFEATTRN